MKRATLSLIFLLISTFAIATEYHIAFFRGDVKIDRGPAHIGHHLEANETVFLGKGAEIWFCSDTKEFVVFSEAGKYGIADIRARKTKCEKAGPVSQALGFFTDQFLHHKEDIRKYVLDHLEVRGGVSRSAGCTYPIMIGPGMGSVVANDGDITFSWDKVEGVEEYTLKVFGNDDLNDPLLIIPPLKVKSTSAIVNAKDLLTENGTIYWVAHPKGQPNCARFDLKLVARQELEKLESELDNAFSDQEDKELALILKAGKAEQEGLHHTALNALDELIKSNPLPEYKELRTLFLARNGMLSQN